MDPATVLRWAWPRSGVGVEAVCWRQRLHEALHRRLGRDPTTLELQYRTTVVVEAPSSSRYRTVVEVHLPPEPPRSYEGATCARQTAAIGSAAWVALLDLCERGRCDPPPEVGGPDEP